MTRKLILIFGVLIGASWMGEVLFGNLGDTPLFENFRMFHPYAYRTIGWSFVSGAVAFTALAGFVATFPFGDFRKAVFTSVCSGLVSGVIVLAGGMTMEVVFHDALRHSPSVLSEFATSGQSDLDEFMLGDALVGGLAHVLIGPALGLTVGAVGAAIGMLALRVRFRLAQDRRD
ncbi:MAG: hypothetical protein ACRD4E_06150 [Bryobacteraceae bacterium]